MEGEFIKNRKAVDLFEAGNDRENPKPNHARGHDVLRDKNLSIKAEMVSELVDTGLPLPCIERILNLEPETLDKLL